MCIHESFKQLLISTRIVKVVYMATNHLMASSQLFVAKLSVYVILQL